MDELEQAELEIGEEAASTTSEEGGEETTVVQETGAEEELVKVVEPGPDRQSELEAQLEAEREQRIRLEERERLRAEQKTEKREPPKEWTRAQLRTAVSEGTIDEDQMEEIWAKQQRAAYRRDTEDLLATRDRERATATTVETEIARYTANYPDVTTIGSPTWNKVKAEFDFCVQLGDDPNSKATEVKALRAALGSSEKIRERTSTHRQTSSETSSSQGGGGGGRPVDIWNRVPRTHKAHYKRLVEEGYMTLEEVKKTIPYMTTETGATH